MLRKTPPTKKLTSGKKNGKEELERNGKGTEKLDEWKSGTQKKTGKQGAQGDEKIQLHVY